jgi:hypothetical protein
MTTRRVAPEITVVGVVLSSLVLLVNVAAAQAPTAASGHPDLSGTWDNGSGVDFVAPVHIGASICVRGCDTNPRGVQAGDRPTYRPEVMATVNDLEARQVEEDTVLRCFAPGVPRIGPPDKIVQTPTELVFLYDDYTGNFFRVVPIDGRPHRTDVEPGYLGDAIGWWEDDTLVVETVNFNDDTWLTDDGSFHTTDLRVIEKLSIVDGTLRWAATAHDPEVLAEPWELNTRTAHRSDSEILEAPPCIERDLDHLVEPLHHDNVR